MRQAILFAFLYAFIAAAGPASAEDWPQWRGPNRDGKSVEKGLLKKWPKEGPTLAWQFEEAGAGYGTPSVADGNVFVMGNGRNGKEWILCLDEKTGKQNWALATGRIKSGGGGFPGPRCTPTYSNGRLYVIGPGGRVFCCDAKGGQFIWKREMATEFGGKEPTWGYSESPLVDGDKVICTPGGQKTVVALEAKTGKEIWAAKVGDPAGYSSVVKATFGETPQYVAFTQLGVVGVSAADGTVLWRYDAPSNGQVNCPTPVVVGDTVFAASGYGKGGGCATIQKDAKGAFTAKQVYFTNKMQCLHGGYLVVDGFLYGCGDPGVLACLNYKTGTVARALHTGRFSIAWADGMLYVRSEDGRMDLYEAAAGNITRKGSFEQPSRARQKAWTHPVIANGHLYLRDQYLLLCYDISAEQAKPAEDGEKSKAKPAEEGAKPKAKPIAQGAKTEAKT
jgi:outer membrane protein assembly factor BamB